MLCAQYDGIGHATLLPMFSHKKEQCFNYHPNLPNSTCVETVPTDKHIVLSAYFVGSYSANNTTRAPFRLKGILLSRGLIKWRLLQKETNLGNRRIGLSGRPPSIHVTAVVAGAAAVGRSTQSLATASSHVIVIETVSPHRTDKLIMQRYRPQNIPFCFPNPIQQASQAVGRSVTYPIIYH